MKIVLAHGMDVSIPCGGTNRVVAFARGLCDNGFDVELVVPKPIREFPRDLQDVRIHTVPIKEKRYIDKIARALLVSLKAKRIAKKNNAILQIEHSTLAGFATLVGCSDFVLDMHDLAHVSPVYLNLPFSKMVQKFIYSMEHKAVSKASKIIVVSNPMKDFIIKEWNVPEEKIEVIPNGYFEDRLEALSYKSVEEVKGLVSFLGILNPNIDCEKIIKLARSLEGIGGRIYVIGEGSESTKLKRMVRKYKLSNVTALGYVPDKEAYGIIAKSQVCIHPLNDTLHIKVAMHIKALEYAALRKAIATDRDATARIFERHNTALVSDPANPNEFIKNVHKFLDDENLRKRLGSNAKKLVKDYTWEKQGKKLVEMYKAMER